MAKIFKFCPFLFRKPFFSSKQGFVKAVTKWSSYSLDGFLFWTIFV